MAVVFVIAIAADGDGCFCGNLRERLYRLPAIGVLHNLAFIPFPELTPFLVNCMQPVYELLTRSELGIPYIEIIEFGVALLHNSTRQISDGADPESLPLFPGRSDLKSTKLEHFVLLNEAGSTGKLQFFDILQYFFGHPFIPAVNLEHFAVRRDESRAQTMNYFFFFRPIIQPEKNGHCLDLLRRS